MKKKICIGILLVLYILTGCKFTSEISKNQEGIDKLASNETLMDIVIDNVHFTLKDKFSTFLDAGWKVSQDSLDSLFLSSIDELKLNAYEYLELTILKEESVLKVGIAEENGINGVNNGDTSVYKIITENYDELNKNIFIDGGVMIGTKVSKLEEIIVEKGATFTHYLNSLIINEGDFVLKAHYDKGIIHQFELFDEALPLKAVIENKVYFLPYLSPEQKRLEEEKIMKEDKSVSGVVKLVESYVLETGIMIDTIYIKGDDGEYRWLLMNARIQGNIDVANLQKGDRVTAYFKFNTAPYSEIDNINVEILVINDEKIVSTYVY